MNVSELKVIAAKDVLEKMKQSDCGGLNFETDVENTFNEEVLRTLVTYGADINMTMDYLSSTTYMDHYLKK